MDTCHVSTCVHMTVNVSTSQMSMWSRVMSCAKTGAMDWEHVCSILGSTVYDLSRRRLGVLCKDLCGAMVFCCTEVVSISVVL